MGNVQSAFSRRFTKRGTRRRANEYRRENAPETEKLGLNGRADHDDYDDSYDYDESCGPVNADLEFGLLTKFSTSFNADAKNRLAANAIYSEDMNRVLLKRQTTIKDTHVFSDKIDREGKATNQHASGRCWLFAATNLLRKRVMEKYKLDDFELSQPYLFFYDKLEKANFFLENMIELVGKEETSSRLIQYLLVDPVIDGGQWDMVVNLIQKYGVVPKSVYPETYHTSNSRGLDFLLTRKLREFACQLRKEYANGQDQSSLRYRKVKMLEEVYRILAIMLGEPPKKFDWVFRDRDGRFQEYLDVTPMKFYKDFVGYDVGETFSLINDPRNQYSRLYTVEYLGNVHGGQSIRYVNVSMDTMKQLAIKVLKSGRPVWFGADVGKACNVPHGILDNEVYDYELGFNLKFNLDKESRLRYGDSAMTHAMLLTGVHLDDGKPVRWRVENSWGEDSGDKGFYVMADSWMSDWVYQIVLEKKDAPLELRNVLGQTPVALPAWDPMGALARM